MAWIRTISDDEADGLLARLYEEARRRAGKVFNIVRAQSLNVRSLRAGIGLYQATTLAPSPVSRGLREMIATVVSRTNGCRY